MGTKKKSSELSLQSRMLSVLKILKSTYPNAHCSLNYKNPYELVVATILSAQCTDDRVNKVTPNFFAAFPTVQQLANGKINEIERLIQSTGFYRNKAKSLLECAKMVIERHDGKIPRTLEDLVKLRGVGRKTANVVLGNAFGIPGLVVDTHVGRLSRRLGFTRATDPVKVEHELERVVPKEDWVQFSHLLIYHGRARCMARNPDCAGCELSKLCEMRGVSPATRKKVASRKPVLTRRALMRDLSTHK
ncbi:MAG TPA: endonuclease III [Oligoflexia bacterium]|nr:endonuclease III [Oligoflexia bacterium]